jgi:hypothetical protein
MSVAESVTVAHVAPVRVHPVVVVVVEAVATVGQCTAAAVRVEEVTTAAVAASATARRGCAAADATERKRWEKATSRNGLGITIKKTALDDSFLSCLPLSLPPFHRPSIKAKKLKKTLAPLIVINFNF